MKKGETALCSFLKVADGVDCARPSPEPAQWRAFSLCNRSCIAPIKMSMRRGRRHLVSDVWDSRARCADVGSLASADTVDVTLTVDSWKARGGASRPPRDLTHCFLFMQQR